MNPIIIIQGDIPEQQLQGVKGDGNVLIINEDVRLLAVVTENEVVRFDK